MMPRIRVSVGELVIFLLCSVSVLTGCSENQGSIEKPAVVGICRDVSGSVSKETDVTWQHVEEIIANIEKDGGILGLCLIGESSSKDPIVRLKLKSVKGNLMEQANIHQENLREIEKFRSLVRPMLLKPREAKTSDVEGALARMSRFFMEAGSEGRRKIFALVSDGKHDGQRILKFKGFNKDVEVLALGIDEKPLQKILGDDVRLFEGVDGLFDELNQMINR